MATEQKLYIGCILSEQAAGAIIAHVLELGGETPEISRIAPAKEAPPKAEPRPSPKEGLSARARRAARFRAYGIKEAVIKTVNKAPASGMPLTQIIADIMDFLPRATPAKIRSTTCAVAESGAIARVGTGLYAPIQPAFSGVPSASDNPMSGSEQTEVPHGP